MAEQSRDVQEQQLSALRRALASANSSLKAAHDLRQVPGHEQSGRDRLDLAQTAVVTLEERIGLLENDLGRVYPTSAQTHARALPSSDDL